MENRLGDFANGGELRRQIADWERRYPELMQHVERLELKLSQLLEPAQVVQQVEWVAKPTLVTEHLSCTCRCHACQANFTKPIAPQVTASGLCGPRLTTRIAYLKGACHASFRTIKQFLRETCGLSLATGTLVKACQKVAWSLQPAYDALRQQIPQESAVNIDETSHREHGQWQWTWVFRAPRFTLFYIDPTRSTEVLNHVLGSKFAGTLMADYYSAYRAYLDAHPRADAQFCLAHFIRDVKFLGESLEEYDRQFAGELLSELQELFRLWHAPRDASAETAWRAALVAQGQ